MANNHGGARPGAGRKSLRALYEPQVAKAEGIYADHLEKAAANIQALADGGLIRVEEKYAPAGSVLVEQVLRDKEGNPVLNKAGQPIICKQPGHPDLDAETPVLIERKVTTLAPDLAANQYISDRILGKPVQAAEVSGPGGGPIQNGVDSGSVDGIFARVMAILDGARERANSGST